MSDSLRPHGLQHARPPRPSPFPRVPPKFMCIVSVMTCTLLILWCPLLLLPSIFLSIRDFSNESAVCIRWAKYWSISFNISPSNKYTGLISLDIDWLDLLAVQGTLRSLLRHHSSKVSILLHSAFFTVWLSQLYMTTGKTITLTIWTSVDREMSLLFNALLILWHFQAPWTWADWPSLTLEKALRQAVLIFTVRSYQGIVKW